VDKAEILLYEMTVVILGSFNPKIFHPDWYGVHGLLKAEEVDKASIQFLNNDVSIFRLEWLKVTVGRDRFQMQCNQEAYFPVLKDLILGTFKLLEHTPLNHLGINRSFVCKFSEERSRSVIFSKFGASNAWDRVLNSPTTAKVFMKGTRADGRPGYELIMFETVPDDNFRFSVAMNEHYENPDKAGAAIKCMDVVEATWLDVQKRAKDRLKIILDLGVPNG